VGMVTNAVDDSLMVEAPQPTVYDAWEEGRYPYLVKHAVRDSHAHGRRTGSALVLPGDVCPVGDGGTHPVPSRGVASPLIGGIIPHGITGHARWS